MIESFDEQAFFQDLSLVYARPPNPSLKLTRLRRGCIWAVGQSRGLVNGRSQAKPPRSLAPTVRLTRSRKLRGRLSNLTAELTARLVDSLVSPALAIDRSLRIGSKAKAHHETRSST